MIGNYELSSHLKPSYLKGDFDGDRKPDIAVLVKEKGAGKIGIAVFHSSNSNVLFIGAGTKLGNGGDNFDWMDIWKVVPRSAAAKQLGKTAASLLKGDALYVEKSESLARWSIGPASDMFGANVVIDMDLRYPIGSFKLETTPSEADIRQAIDTIAEAPTKLRAAVAGFITEQLDTPYRPDGWTVQQVVHHVPRQPLEQLLPVQARAD